MRRARVLSVSGETAEIELLEGPLAGTTVPGVFYRHLGTPPSEGEEVRANTVGLEMGLGSGGVAVILSPLGAASAPPNENHFMKLPYTPLQFPAPAPPQSEDLCGVPIAVLPLHSHLAPACCAAASVRPGCRVAFVWQEGGALPVALSMAVQKLAERELLQAVISVGNCFGGDLEAPNVYAGLLAAPALGADLVLAGIGPGVVGTATACGHGGMAAALALNAACALGGSPVLAPRLSLADPRPRHQGFSHHTRAALHAALAPCRVALPPSWKGPIGDLPERHSCEVVRTSAAGLQERFGLSFESMGRGYEEDPVFFDAAACAAALALGEGAA